MNRLSKERLDSLSQEWLKDVEEKSKILTQLSRPNLDISNGLINLYNNCYINSIIHCIGSMKTLLRHLNGSFNNFQAILVNSEFSFLRKFLQVLQDIQSDKKISFENLSRSSSVKNFIEFMEEFFQISRGQFVRNSQNDAHEFFLWLIDILEHYFSTIMDIIYYNDEEKDIKHEGLIKIFFSLNLNQHILCNNGHQTLKCSNEICLSLDIEKTETLEESLKIYFETEHLNQLDTLFFCNDCQTKVKAIKNLKILNSKEILILHLKRFKV